jgi:hypothetical protein
LAFEDGTNRLTKKTDNCQLVVLNIPEEQRPHLHCSGSLKSVTVHMLLK